MRTNRKISAAKKLLGKKVEVIIDKPLRSKHPKYSDNIPYPINYGYIPETLASDGKEVDAFVIGSDRP